MQLKTILNRIEPYKSFVYGKAQMIDTGRVPRIEVTIEPRANGRPLCSSCGRPAPGYDRQPQPRRFEYVPLWGMAVCFLYRMRRVNCATCGVKTEQVPWADGKCQLTTSYRWFLARWAKRLSWKETASAFHTTWENVFRAVKHAVSWGLVHRDERGITAIGIDEIQWSRGHNYLTLVYQINEGCKRLLWVGSERKEETLRAFFRLLTDEVRTGIRFVCSDMWKPYLQVIREEVSQAVHVLDRFHLMKKMNEAIDQVRREEAARLKQDGYEHILKHARWCLLKRPENLTDQQTVKLRELMKYNLRSLRARLLREDFQRFWNYSSPGWAGKFLDEWCRRTMRSQLEPMKKVAASLRRHRPLILNWFRARGAISAGIVEGFNNKAKLTTRKAYGFRTFEAAETALYHALGALPEAEFTHEFC
jgi:transposase